MKLKDDLMKKSSEPTMFRWNRRLCGVGSSGYIIRRYVKQFKHEKEIANVFGGFVNDLLGMRKEFANGEKIPIELLLKKLTNFWRVNYLITFC